MSRFIFLILFICGLSQITIAQSIDTIYPELHTIVDIRSFDSTKFLLVTSDAKIHHISLEGELLQSIDIAPTIGDNKSIISVFDAFPDSQDSFFYVTTIDDHCDYFVDPRLFKIQNNGNVLEVISLVDYYFTEGRLVYPPGPGHPKYILPSEDGLVVWYAADNTSLIPLNYPQRIEVSNKGDIAVLSNNKINYFIRDSNGSFPNRNITVTNSYIYNAFFFTSGNSLLWSQGKNIVLFNSDLDTLFQYHTSNDEEIVFVAESKTNFIVISEDVEDNLSINILDSNLNLVFNDQLLYKKKDIFYHIKYISDILEGPDSTFLFTGKEFYKEDKLYSFVKTFNISSNAENKRQDVGISHLGFDKVRQGGLYHCYSDSTRVYFVENASIEITNNGTDTINSMIITSLKSYCFWWCEGEKRYHYEIDDLKLGPGETKEYAMGSVGIEVSKHVTPNELCLTAILPDLKLDADHDDNVYCFDVTTGIEIDRAGVMISLFPNPAEDMLYFSSSTVLNDVSIFNLEGKVVLGYPDARSSEIDVSILTPGIYFLRGFVADGNLIYKKFIKH